MSTAPVQSSRFWSPSLWFAVILTIMCAWVLSLPVFPSQDGPMHRYYVHVLDSLLRHQTTFDWYQIRHPFPPYATQYFLLMGLSHLFSLDVAEKLLVCIIFIGFAFGFRLTAKAIGPAGNWTSLFFAPLLLSWSLMMGFFNYVLGVSVLLLALACWQRSRAGSRAAFGLYLLALAVLTFTHPIPLLLLLSLTGLDLLLGWGFRERALSTGRWLRREALRIFGFVCTFVALGFPALAVDHSSSTTARTLADTHFKMDYLRTALLLTGVSPYNSRSLHLWINVYRISLYSILGIAVYFGFRACRQLLRERHPDLGSTLFIATVLLAIALPILPNSVNGSWYFSTRLTMVLWPAALIAASAASAPRYSYQRILVSAAVGCAIFTLIPAEQFFRPVANEFSIAENTAVPPHRSALLLSTYDLEDYARYQKQLAFDPYQWIAMLPLTKNDDIALDAPWMDQKITPLLPKPGTPLTLEDISATHSSKTAPPLVSGRSLPASQEANLVRDASFLLFSGPPTLLNYGLESQLSMAEADQFTCSRAQVWLLLCLRK